VSLEAAGHHFATHSDTEVAVHAYEQYGDAFLGRLEGMFGLALWDRRRRRLLVARDAIGIKPIYYRLADRELMFASEAKALLAVPGVSARLDPGALAQYLSVGYVCAPNAMFDACASLEHRQGTRCRRWASAAASLLPRLPAEIDEGRSEEEWVEACVPSWKGRSATKW